MRKEIFNVLNILLTLVSTTIIGFTICFKFFHLEPLRILLNTENQTLQFNELELEKLDYYSYAFLGINAFVLVISMCSAISKNVNRNEFTKSIQSSNSKNWKKIPKTETNCKP